MPKKAKAQPTSDLVELGQRPRLTKLIIKNFRCIGNEPVSIELDDIVVLVGPNNVGKSSVLKAYEVIMSEGSAAGKLSIEDFPSGKVDPSYLPEIELHTIVYDNSPGSEWVTTNAAGEQIVREKWTWVAPGDPVRRGYLVTQARWATDEDAERVPWGAAQIANSRRPQPHRVDAFASPDSQAGDIIDLLMTAIKDRVKALQQESKTNTESDFAKLLKGIASLQKKIVAESQEQIATVQGDLSSLVGKIFPGHQVVFDAKAEDDLDKAINLFKSNPRLLMGPENGYLSSVGLQGSGARRTLLWTAIKMLADKGKKKDSTGQRPHVLLIDEPEICLHPAAIREASELLYALPGEASNWQVVVTTHSPCFIDFARDHTSIVRVERKDNGQVTGTTIYRPSKAGFDGSDKERLKLLNQCDPYVAEFFFGGKTIIVEGDTEYTAFMHVKAMFPEKYRGIHVVRARGKATIVSLCKVLNQFGAAYSILHDSDRETYQKDGTDYAHPSWALNESIRTELGKSVAPTRLLASIPNFEQAYLGDEVIRADKPYNALSKLTNDSAITTHVASLLDALIDFTKPVPEGAVQWTSIEELRHALQDS